MSKRHNSIDLFRSCAVAGMLACVVTLAACSDDKDGGGGGAKRITLGTATRIDPGTNKYFSLEGPYWDAKTSTVLFSDVVEKNGAETPAGEPMPKIHKYDPATNMFSVFPYPTPMPASTNGLGMDSMGRLLVTERVNARVVRVEGTMLKELATMYMGVAFNAPNDMVVGNGDNIYFTDTLWGSKKAMGDLAPNSAYRIAPDGMITKIHSDSSINGIALSPDGKTLYIGNDMASTVVKFAVGADGAVTGAAQPFLTKASIPGDLFSIPDGINVDDSGNVYVAMNDNVTNSIAVFDPAGTYLGEYMVPVALDPGKMNPKDGPGNGPSNVTFGGADRKTMYITTHHTLWKATAPTAGKP